MRKIICIWFKEAGDDQFINVGYPFMRGTIKCTEIREKSAQGEGDRWFYDAIFEDGSMKRIFNPDTVDFAPPNPDQRF